jgi:hypothetical protein
MQMVLEVSGNGEFENGGCNKKRTNSNGAKLVTGPASGDIIEIKALWARTYDEGVRIASPFFFRNEENIDREDL